MITLSTLHYIYIFMTILILVALVFKKEIVVPCIIGVLLIGYGYSKNILSTIQILNNAIVASCVELLGIIVVIAAVVAMSRAMIAVGADEALIRPVRGIIKTKNRAFFGIGLAMLIVSWLIWPSPAVALIGALLLPVASKVGLTPIWAAVAMNIFGHGAGLSSDFFIQGAPSISASAAGVATTDVMSASLPLWAVMCITVVAISYFMMRRELKHNPQTAVEEIEQVDRQIEKPGLSKVMAVLIPVAFLADVVLMVRFHVTGGDATALVTGTALILRCGCVGSIGKDNGLFKRRIYFRDSYFCTRDCHCCLFLYGQRVVCTAGSGGKCHRSAQRYWPIYGRTCADE